MVTLIFTDLTYVDYIRVHDPRLIIKLDALRHVSMSDIIVAQHGGPRNLDCSKPRVLYSNTYNKRR